MMRIFVVPTAVAVATAAAGAAVAGPEAVSLGNEVVCVAAAAPILELTARQTLNIGARARGVQRIFRCGVKNCRKNS